MRPAPWVWFGLAVAWIAVLVLAPLFGAEPLAVADILTGRGQAFTIYWELRLPRVLLGMLTGSMLAGSGLAFQALFRNPLATPFTLGTSSGASLGAALYLAAGGASTFLGLPGVTGAAFAGALAALGLVWALARPRTGVGTETMLLAGVAISFMCSGWILLVQYLADQAHSLRVLRWLMGGFDLVSWTHVLQTLPAAVLGLTGLWFMRYALDLFTFGEEVAHTRGLDIRRSAAALLLVSGLMESTVVASAGPVGFAGLMVPHLCRLLVGPRHAVLLPASILLGGIFLPLCDTAARCILSPAELPVGIITALLGAPFFLWLLVRSHAPRR